MAEKAELLAAEEVPTDPPTAAPIQRHQEPATAPISLFGTTDPAEVVEAATRVAQALVKPLEDRKLYKEIAQDRKYVYVEGWTLLGSMLQVYATTQWTKKQTDADGDWRPPKTEKRTVERHSKWCKNGSTNADGEATHRQVDGCKTYSKEADVVVEEGHGGWEARVEAYTAGGILVGAAEAECMWEEPTWANRDSYALRSMAQTRATSKALRQPLGFVVELAGFKATPAEEVPDDGFRDEPGRDADADTYQGPRCPACHSRVYDNRADNQQREAAGKKPWPAFKCANRRCTGGDDGREWATWSTSYFDEQAKPTDPSVPFKTEALHAVEAAKENWVIRYAGAEPESFGDDRLAGLAAQAITDDDPRLMAGVLWTALIGDNDPTDRRILRTTITAFRYALEKPELSLQEAWAKAADLIEMAEQEAPSA